MKKKRHKHPSPESSAKKAAAKRRLELYREPGSAEPRLRFVEAVFTEAYQNSLALATAHTALEILEGTREEARLLMLGEKLLGAMSELASRWIERGTAGAVACGDGCAYCCHQIVGATPLELFVIWKHLERAGIDLARLKERARQLAERARGLSKRERYRADQPCVFLENSRCSIYEARPLTCRGVNALDKEICRNMLEDEERGRAFWERGEGSPGYLEPLRGAHALSAGLQLALSELYGLDMHPVDLTLAIDLLLADPERIDRWQRGESPFVAVRSGQGPKAGS